MNAQTPVLDATKRDRLGSRYTQRLRDQGRLPAVVYGHKEQPVAVALDAREALTHIHKGEKVFQLRLEGAAAPQTVLLKDVQFDYLGTRIIHCDLARVSLSDRVSVRVPVRLIGEAPGLKHAGAILMHPTAELEIECVVTDIPDFIEVELATLDLGHAITAAEVKLPMASMKLKTDGHAIVAQVIIQQEIKTEEQAVVEAGPAEPEVITAKKPEEGEAAEGAKPGAKAPAKDKAPAKPAAKEEKKK